MNAIVDQKSSDVLRQFIPLNSLPDARFDQVCSEAVFEVHEKNAVLFEQGETADEFVYLLSGMVGLFAGEMEMETIVTGSEAARFAIAHHTPRKVKAVAKSKIKIARLKTHLLEVSTSSSSEDTYMVDEVEEHGGDWMTTMLQSPVFQRLPAANLQKIMMKMEEVAFEAGQVVVKQGDEADYYYIIKQGDCELIRQHSETARPVKLAELHSCEAFGEDALLSGKSRNVTVRMKDRGQMLRLPKEDFISLVKTPVLQYVDFEKAQQEIAGGAHWLDVRSTEAFEENNIAGSDNIPFFSLRMKIAELRHDQLQVLVCENGRTSEAAAFLLLKFGFNALILKDGIDGLNGQTSVQPTSENVEQDSTDSVGKNDAETSTEANDQLLKAAQEEIHRLERQCASTNEQYHQAETKYQTLLHELEKKTNLAGQLETALQDAQTQLDSAKASVETSDELSAALEQANRQTNALKAELEQTKTQETKLKEKLQAVQDAWDGEKASLDQQVESLKVSQQEQINELQQNLVASKLNAEQALAEIQNKATALEASEEKQHAFQQEIEQLKDQLQRKESERRTEQEEHHAQSKALVSLENQLSSTTQTYEQDKAQLNQQITALEKELEDAKNQLKQDGQTSDELTAVIEKTKAELQAAQNDKLSSDEKSRSLQSQLDEQQATLASANQQAEQQQEKLSTLETELEKTKAELVTSTDQLNEQLKKQKELEQVQGLVTGENESLKEQIQCLTKSLEDEQTQTTSLEQASGKIEAELAQAKQTESQLLEQIEQLKPLKVEVENLNEKLQEAHASLETISSGKQSFESELNDRLTSLQQKNDETVEQNNALKAQLTELAQEKENLTTATTEKETELNAEVIVFKDQVEALQKQNDELKAHLEVINAENNQTAQTTDEIAQALQTAQSDVLAKDSEITKLQETINASEETSKTLQTECVELRTRLEEREQEVRTLSSNMESSVALQSDEVKALKERLEQQQIALDEAQEENKQTLTHNAKLEEKAGDMEKQLAQLSQQNKELEAVQSSVDDYANEVEILKEKLIKSEQAQNDSKTAVSSSNEQVCLMQTTIEALEKENANLMSKIEQIISVKDSESEEKQQLEETIEKITEQNKQLEIKLKSLGNKPSSTAEQRVAQARIEELEKQLDETSAALLDYEIQAETNKTLEIGEGVEKDQSAIDAIKSELALVREQSEKDIHLMQGKLDASEKMNLALKKKIISMQSIANQEVVVESQESEKKKKWWK